MERWVSAFTLRGGGGLAASLKQVLSIGYLAAVGGFAAIKNKVASRVDSHDIKSWSDRLVKAIVRSLA